MCFLLKTIEISCIASAYGVKISNINGTVPATFHYSGNTAFFLISFVYMNT